MKYLFLLLFLSLFTFQCSSQQETNSKEDTAMKPEKNEEGEWELVVFDAQYQSFLNGIARPKNAYSETWLKSRNRLLVSEWNSHFFAGRFRNIIESSIDYDPNENYGFDFEYQLYQVFAYANWQYGLRLNHLSAMDRRK